MGKILACILCLFIGFIIKAEAQDSVLIDEAPQEDVYDAEDYNENYFKKVAVIEKVEEREIPDSIVKEVKADDAYWYANEAPKRKEKKPQTTNVLDQGWAKTLFWLLLIAAFVALLIWFLASINIRLFRRTRHVAYAEENDEAITEDIFGLNYEIEIKKAIDALDYRLAVRLLFLQTLKILSERSLIKYTHERTNSDYLFQLSKSRYYSDFFRLTRNFEYVWYGKLQISPEAFSLVQKDFSTFKQQLA